MYLYLKQSVFSLKIFNPAPNKPRSIHGQMANHQSASLPDLGRGEAGCGMGATGRRVVGLTSLV